MRLPTMRGLWQCDRRQAAQFLLLAGVVWKENSSYANCSHDLWICFPFRHMKQISLTIIMRSYAFTGLSSAQLCFDQLVAATS